MAAKYRISDNRDCMDLEGHAVTEMCSSVVELRLCPSFLNVKII
jgi:hypothetical protein